MTPRNDLVVLSNSPPLAELLAEETALLAARRDELLAAAERAPQADADTAGKIADLARLVAACIKAAEDAHKERKAPLLADGRAVDAAYKRQIIEPLSEAKERLANRLARYQGDAGVEQVRGELGSVSSLREEWIAEIEDRSAIDLNTIHQHFSDDAIERAIKAAIRDGVRKLSGVKIFKSFNVTVR